MWLNTLETELKLFNDNTNITTFVYSSLGSYIYIVIKYNLYKI